MKKTNLFKSLFVVLALSLCSFTAFAAEKVIKNIFDYSTMRSYITDYESSWNNTSGLKLGLTNFNNGDAYWYWVKCGRKDIASVATIKTNEAIAYPISKVVVKVDKVTVEEVNSTYLEISTDADFATVAQKIDVTIAQGDVTYTIPTPTANCYYRLTYDCKAGTADGFVQISQVDFYYTAVNAPALSHESGIFSAEEVFDLTITASEEGDVVKYTLNGGAEQTYSAPVHIAETTTIVAWAEANGLKSEEVTATYTILAEGVKFYNHTIGFGNIRDINCNVTLSDVEWYLGVTGTDEFRYTSWPAQSFGTSSLPATEVKLSTSGIAGKITKVVVSTWAEASETGVATLGVTVGGIAYGEAATLANEVAEYTFVGNEEGEIVLTWTNNSGKTLYIQSIYVEYAEATAGPSVAVENAEIANIYTENGMIVVDGEYEIYTVTGQNVTDMNGRLENGIYVVCTANAIAKVVVK